MADVEGKGPFSVMLKSDGDGWKNSDFSETDSFSRANGVLTITRYGTDEANSVSDYPAHAWYALRRVESVI